MVTLAHSLRIKSNYVILTWFFSRGSITDFCLHLELSSFSESIKRKAECWDSSKSNRKSRLSSVVDLPYESCFVFTISIDLCFFRGDCTRLARFQNVFKSRPNCICLYFWKRESNRICQSVSHLVFVFLTRRCCFCCCSILFYSFMAIIFLIESKVISSIWFDLIWLSKQASSKLSNDYTQSSLKYI